MKGNLSSLTIRRLVGILFLFLCVLIYLPSFKLHFLLLDDGLTILNARMLVNGLVHLNWNTLADVFLEPLNGRVRPGYWLIESVFAYLSLYNSYLFHFFRFILLLATLVISYKFLEKLKIYYPIILFSLFIFLFNIQNFENYYRLGPVEPLIIFLSVVIYYLLFFSSFNLKKSLILLVFSTLLGGLTKENFFLIGLSLAPLLFVSVLQKNKVLVTKVTAVIASSVFIGAIVFLIKASYPTGGVYASNYIINIPSIIANTIS